ncbi:hypothetical protein FJT64_016255 [Amphibalanus amphitrite]|uniref:Uncharacterized protein n=1 Tax=Amphibalanus amphitrite TaxID=1232801 RepID=A0A6A4X1N4_AMPAM|nr:hypothetical protein FJT64_016255 [Amphibalanus amphitrite]
MVSSRWSLIPIPCAICPDLIERAVVVADSLYSVDGPGTGMSYTELEAGYQGLRRAPAGFYIGDDAAAAIIRSSSSGLSAVLKSGLRTARGVSQHSNVYCRADRSRGHRDGLG